VLLPRFSVTAILLTSMREKCFPDLCFYTYCCPNARWVILSRWVPARSCFRTRPEGLRPPKRTPRNILRMLDEMKQERRAAAAAREEDSRA